jgi:hypothetical protein
MNKGKVYYLQKEGWVKALAHPTMVPRRTETATHATPISTTYQLPDTNTKIDHSFRSSVAY